MIILGIDPGFDRLGIAIIKKEKGQKEEFIHSECFKTNREDTFAERLFSVGKRLEHVIDKYKPDCVGIETLFMGTNQKTGMYVAEARGVLQYVAITKNLQIFEYTPLQIKTAITGYGKADKTQMMSMIPKIISIPHETHSDDELDAVAVAITTSAYNRF